MSEEKKNSGRRLAMVNTMKRLGTFPSEYTPDYKSAAWGTIHNCELCGAALVYSFKLTHGSDPEFKNGKSIYIGGDCVVNFAELHMPDMATQIMEFVKQAQECARLAAFKAANPTIDTEMNEVMLKLREITTLHSRARTALYSHPLIDSIITSSRELRSRRYLSGPKVEKFKQAKERLISGDFGALGAEHCTQYNTLNPLTVAEDSKVDPSFYALVSEHKEFMTYGRGFRGSFNARLQDQRAFSRLEKEVVSLMIAELAKDLKKEKSTRDSLQLRVESWAA